MASVLDVQTVAAAQRAHLWKRSAGRFFPGLSVHLTDESLAVGTIRGLPFGAGRLWSVLSPPLLLDYTPRKTSLTALDEHFSVMLQLEGSTLACQRQHQCRLQRGDFCLIDSSTAFSMQVAVPASHIMFIQMPRTAVLGRHPSLERYTACAFDPLETGSALLRNLLLQVVDCAHLLADQQRAAVLGAVMQLLGAPKHGCLYPEELPRRVRAALSCIEDELADRSLTATRVAQAQGISRRRLDELMLQWLGFSVAAQIAERRLQQAAAALADPEHARLSVLQIAFAAGFEDPAHFSRAFKRRFGCTPRQWRSRTQPTGSDIPPPLSA